MTAVAPVSLIPAVNDTAISMASNLTPSTNMGNFSSPIVPPAAVIKLSPEATALLEK